MLKKLLERDDVFMFICILGITAIAWTFCPPKCFGEETYTVVNPYTISITTTTTKSPLEITYEKICANLASVVNAKVKLLDEYNTSISAKLLELGKGGDDTYIQGIIDGAVARHTDNLAKADANIAMWQARKNFAEKNGANGLAPASVSATE